MFALLQSTDQLQLTVASKGQVGGFLQCDQPNPIQSGKVGSGCIGQIVTLIDGGVDQLFGLGLLTGELACVAPLSGSIDATLSGDAGVLKVQATF